MSLTISLAFLYSSLVMFLLAMTWQLRNALTLLRDSWDLRPSLFRAAMLVIVGTIMLATVLMMPYTMLVFAFVYGVFASAVLAFGVERLRRPPATECKPFWYVGDGGEHWEQFRSSLSLIHI